MTGRGHLVAAADSLAAMGSLVLYSESHIRNKTIAISVSPIGETIRKFMTENDKIPTGVFLSLCVLIDEVKANAVIEENTAETDT